MKGPWNVFDAAAKPIMFISGIFDYDVGLCVRIYVCYFFLMHYRVIFQTLPIFHQYKLQN